MTALTMTEADLQRVVVDYARMRGCLVFHDNDSRRNVPGFPDLVIVGAKGFLLRELKSQGGRLRTEQDTWISRLARAGADVGVWRPSDWPGRVRDEIEAIR